MNQYRVHLPAPMAARAITETVDMSALRAERGRLAQPHRRHRAAGVTACHSVLSPAGLSLPMTGMCNVAITFGSTGGR